MTKYRKLSARELAAIAPAVVRATLRAATWQMPGMPTLPTPPPVYASWGDYLARTPRAELRTRCVLTAKRMNRKRLLSPAPKQRGTADLVWSVLSAARGRCAHWGSLAVERRPSNPVTGAPVAWAQVGRRVGALEHRRCRFDGGENDHANLAWCCLWCNTWESECRWGATDHGGHYPDLSAKPTAEECAAVWRPWPQTPAEHREKYRAIIAETLNRTPTSTERGRRWRARQRLAALTELD
jgi:hypothetical protein